MRTLFKKFLRRFQKKQPSGNGIVLDMKDMYAIGFDPAKGECRGYIQGNLDTIANAIGSNMLQDKRVEKLIRSAFQYYNQKRGSR